MFVQIPGYPRYLIDENGVVVSTCGGKWKVLKLERTHDGYQRATLGAGNRFPVHRLVMLTFVGPSDLTVNHKNGDKTDNRLDNLEYLTASENLKHAYKTGLIDNKGEKCSTAKLSDLQAAQLLALKGTVSQVKAGKLFGVTQASVGYLWSGKSWRHLHEKRDT